MKKISVLILPVIILVISLGPIYAKEISQLTKDERKAQVQQTIEERRQLNTQRRLELKQTIEERKASQAARLADIRRQRISHFFGLMKKRIEALILRIERLIARIESRLAKIEETEEEIDTANIHENLDTAKALLEESKDLLILAEEELENTLSSEDPKEAFEIVRETIHQIRDNLKEVHRLLVHVIGDLKGLRVGQTEVQDDDVVLSVTPTDIPTATESAE